MRTLEAWSETGFALVELLASLSVLALLSLLILAGVSGRSAAWRRIDGQTARTETIEAVQAMLYDRLQRITPVTVFNTIPPGPDFDGQPDHVVFLAPPPESLQPSPVRRYQLALDPTGELVLASRSDVALDQLHWPDRQVLLQGVQAFDLAYFGVTGANRTPNWYPRWGQQPAMPTLIRIRIAFQPGDPRRWPDLIVHPVADTDTFCLVLPTNGACAGR